MPLTRTTEGQANALIHETSPYLLQHAHNPVQWVPWGPEAMAQAEREGKLLLVSIGYSACHWCHVMEHESFEDEEVAALMNEHFVCVKVDREERPDVDQVYMDAVQIMRGSGGWPLNCFALPDGRPIYGGTYFPKAQWLQVLRQVQAYWTDQRPRALDYATQLTQAIREIGQASAPSDADLPRWEADDLHRGYIRWQQHFDTKLGGTQRAPKFPLPVAWRYLLHYGQLAGNDAAEAQALRTLDALCLGGIYDQVGGGLTRYSTDVYWLVPHFEKMLYDNGQFALWLAEAFQLTRKPLYERTLRQTLDFVARELKGPDGELYSALDADSEGEEGKFYVWTTAEIDELLPPNLADLAKLYYQLIPSGNWEHGQNIPHRQHDDPRAAEMLRIPLEELRTQVAEINRLLLAARSQRLRPGLDDKVLAGWNGLMARGMIEAGLALGAPEWIAAGRRTIDFVLTQMRNGTGLFRSWKGGHARINAYLDDYAAVVDALLALYRATWEERYVHTAQELVDHTLGEFYDAESGYFYYTSAADDPLIARKMELNDTVIPSSNAHLAHSLLTLSHYLHRPDYAQVARRMLAGMRQEVIEQPSSHAEWARLALREVFPDAEVVIAGPAADRLRAEWTQHFVPQALLMGHNGTGPTPTLPLLQHKLLDAETLIFVCQNQTCSRPVGSVAEALEELRKL